MTLGRPEVQGTIESPNPFDPDQGRPDVKASCSMFCQILKLISRTDFERIDRQTGAEYRSKGLSSWSRFVAMLFCQSGRAHSLREIEPTAQSLRVSLNTVERLLRPSAG